MIEWIESDGAEALVRRLRRPIVNLAKPNRVAVGSTIVIHIGKCGGTTLKKAMRASGWSGKFNAVHMRRPPVRRDLRYYILARHPIRRSLSAFNWRYKLVVEDGAQSDRFPGELEALTKYQSLSRLGESLYHANGAPNAQAHRDIRKIHHLREDINFYLGDLLDFAAPAQIIDVLLQETLDADILRAFNYENRGREKSNPADATTTERMSLSAEAEKNLRRYFRRDFECLRRLHDMGKISRETFATLN